MLNMATSQKKIKDIGRSKSMTAHSPQKDRKSATLPAGIRPIPSSSGEGFFTKLKRCLRIGSKGRYEVNAVERETFQVQPTSVQETGEMQKVRSIVSRTTSLRVSRRAHVDKEEVILIRKGKMKSGNGIFPNRSISETIPEDGEQTVVHIVNGGTPLDTGQTSGAEAALDDEVFDMDPGYETLDEIRKKVRLQQAAKQQKKSEVKTDNVSKTVEASKPKDLGEARNGFVPNENGTDSGITTPTTESPESGRDSQARSVTSSMFSDTALTEGSNQIDLIEPDEITLNGGTMHRLNSCPADTINKPQRNGQRYSSDSFLTKSLQDDTDPDLYANPQILFRKQSKMGQNKSVSASTIAVGGAQAAAETQPLPQGLGEKSVSEGDIKPVRGSSVESDNTAPPLPDRRYLESEVRTSRGETDDEHSADNDCSTSTTISANHELSPSATHDSVASISSIREVCVSSSENLKTPETESPRGTSLQDKSGFSCGKYDTIERVVVAFISTEPSSGFVTGVFLEKGTHDSQITKSDSAASTSEHNLFALQNCTENVTRTRDNTSSKSNSCEMLSKPEGLSNYVHNAPIERTAQCTTAQTLEAKNFQTEDTKLALSRSQESIAIKQTLSSTFVDQTEHGAQNPSKDLQTAEGCENTSSDISERNPGGPKVLPIVQNDVPFKSDSVCFVERRDASGSSDPSCAHDNVVVIKLHESTHEDCLTGDEAKSEEGVSDESIARLEEKAAMLQLGAHGKNINHHHSNESGLSSESAQIANSKHKTEGSRDFSESVQGAKALPTDGQNVSGAANQVQEPVPKARSRKSKKREEPIHMSLAEVMHSQTETEDGCQSDDDDDDYQDLAEDEDQEEQAEGGAPAETQQINPNSATAAHRAFLESMRQLKDCGWYWGPLSYSEAMSKLINKPDGSFLVRDSSSENYILSLSFKCMGSVCHTRIEHNKGVFSFWSQPDSHGMSTIRDFIEQAVRFSHTGKFLYFLRPSGPGSPPISIRLLYPVSRFCRVPSLQHMCRFLILRWVRRDHIDVLPVPEKVKDYLRENQYYVETLDED